MNASHVTQDVLLAMFTPATVLLARLNTDSLLKVFVSRTAPPTTLKLMENANLATLNAKDAPPHAAIALTVLLDTTNWVQAASRLATPTCLLTMLLISVSNAHKNARPAAALLSVPLVPTLKLSLSMESVTIVLTLATHAHHLPQLVLHVLTDST